MTNREKALQIADVARKRAEAHDHMDMSDAMLYALVLALADIGEQLEKIDTNLCIIYADGIVVD